MEAILRLEELGYRISLSGGTIRCVYRGDKPRPEEVASLLKILQQHRDAAVSFLQQRASREVRTPTGLEAEAQALLERIDHTDGLEWCRQWAEVMRKMNAPCTGSPSWGDWLAEVEADLKSGA
jgi:hypothetical protein